MGQLNIKDPALIAEARELAALLGTTTTAALREAVRERLAREKAAREAKAAAILEIGRRVRASLPPEALLDDHGELLYDPGTGLPR